MNVVLYMDNIITLPTPPRPSGRYDTPQMLVGGECIVVVSLVILAIGFEVLLSLCLSDDRAAL